MDYPGWINAITSLLEYQVADNTSATPTDVAAFNVILPAAIDYTENRIQRDLDFIATTITATGTMTANNRTVTLPVVDGSTYIVTTQIRLTGQPPLEPVTRDYLDFAWPSETSLGAGIAPVQWCPNDQINVLVGPAPDQAYPFEVVGTMRFKQLSSTNTSNFLTLQVPDLYVMCSMIFFSAYQRDFGGQSDDPQQAQSYEAQYQGLLKSAQVEEVRKNYANMCPSPSSPATLQGG